MANTRKRALSLALCLLMIFSLLPTFAAAADTVLDGIGVEDLEVSYSEYHETILGQTAGSCSCSVTGLDSLKATATGAQKSKWGITVTLYNQITIDFRNQKDKTARLTFAYNATPGNGSITIKGNSVTGSGTFSELVQPGKSIQVIVKSNKGAGTSTLTISGITLLVEEMATTTFEPASHGSYTVDDSAITETTSRTQLSTVAYAVKATPSSGYKFVCWYDPVAKQIISYTQNTSLYFDTDHTVTAIFEPTNTPVYEVEGALFTELNSAISYAQTNDKPVIVLIGKGTLPAGDYTIPSGKTLLIPCDDSHSLFTTAPEVLTSHTTPSAYRTLTMANGANITVQSGGAISVSSRLSATGTGSGSWNGTPTGAGGRIVMNAGSNISVQSGGKLYTYGYISGSGTVTAKSGSEIWECFQLRDWRGGTATSGMEGNSQKVFPMNQYYVQNIEAPLTLEAGAVEKVYTAVNMSSKAYATSATFVGSGGMFQITSGSLTKRYDGASDRLVIDVNGNVSITSMSLEIHGLPIVGDVDLNTADYVLPINSNITINVNPNAAVSVGQAVAFLPGTILSIAKDAVVNINSGVKAYVYDQDDWGPYAANSLNLVPVGYSTVNGTTAKRTAASLVDAKIDVNGTVNVSGEIYTTTGGAAIISSEKTGVVNLVKKAGTENRTYQVTQGGSDGTEISYVTIAITAAQLQNGDSSFYQTADKPAGTEIPYSKSLDVWGVKDSDPLVVHFDANGGEGDVVTVEAAAGETVSLANPGFVKQGHNFVGWYLMEAGNEQFFFPAESMTEIDASDFMELGEVTFYAKWEPATYQIKFVNDDGTQIGETQTVEYNQMPTVPADPTKASTAEYDYTFSGWSPAVAAATADQTYTATYTAEKRSYTITWKHEDGSVINTTTVPYGETPTHADDTKAATDEYTYTFAGWSPALTAVTGDAEYTATFTAAKNAYTVKFVDWNGNVLKSDDVAYGEMPAAPADPTRTGDAQYSYNFTGWDKEIAPVTGEATYTATYEQVLNRYTVKFVWENGTVSEADYDYGKTPVVPAAPQKDADAQYTYTFAGWLDETGAVVSEIPAVTGDATYTASYTGTLRSYTITFDVDGQQTSFTKEYGTEISSFKPADPTKTDPNGVKEYTFTGWQLKDSDTMLGETDTVTGEAIYVAVFEESDRVFTYYWYDGIHDEPLYTTTDVANQSPDFPYGNPTKEGDAQYTYTFAGWQRADDLENAVVTFTAYYNAELNWYQVTFDPANGETLDPIPVQYGETPTAPADPQKQADAQYTYTFAGWADATGAITAEFPAVTGNVTYTAVYTAEVNSYTVTWMIDGVAEEETYQYGVTPSHTDPVKEADAYYSYAFTGWDPEIASVTGNVTYTAQFAKVSRISVTFLAPDLPGTELVTLTGGQVDSATVQQQPNYPSYMGWTFTGVTVTSGDQTETINADVVTNEALNDVIARVLAASGSQDVTVTANYRQTDATYTVNLKYKLPSGEIVDNFTTEPKAVGEAMRLTTSAEYHKGADTYYFDHWVVDGKEYKSLSITVRPEKAGSYDAVAVYVEGESAANEPVLQVVNAYKETQNDIKKIAVTLSYNVPEGCTVQAVGFRVSTKDPTLETTYSTATSKLTTNDGSYTLHINVNNKADKNVYVCAYLTYTDASGESHTILTDPVAYVWNDMNP